MLQNLLGHILPRHVVPQIKRKETPKSLTLFSRCLARALRSPVSSRQLVGVGGGRECDDDDDDVRAREDVVRYILMISFFLVV